jgi:hypothetical protein
MRDPQEQRAEAVRRLRRRRDFTGSLVAYVLVNLLLVAIWFFTDRDGGFWPIWTILGWGVGMAFYAWSVFGQKPISDAEIDRELARERGR